MASRAEACDVLVVGLGPVGLLLTALLRRSGVAVLAVERDAVAPDLPRAATLDDEALRALATVGCAAPVVEAGVVLSEARLRLRDGRAVTLMRTPAATANGHPALVGIHQPLVEEALAAHVGDAARRGIELRALEQDRDGVLARLSDGPLRARYVVGCDGARSAVRAAAGIRFGGTTFAQRWLVVDARVAERGPAVAEFVGDPRAPAVTLPLGEARRRAEVMVAPGTSADPAFVARLAGPGAEPHRAAVYTFHARTAERWRAGRVLLAGDAAHLMPPFAGQGLGSGLRDAVNLAWKLAAVVGGHAGEELLDTYEAERRPHVVRMTALARFVGALVQTRRPRLALARDASLTALDGTALAAWLQRGAPKPPATLPRRFVTRTPGAGRLLPQSDPRLDEALGGGWSVVRAAEVADDLTARWLREHHADWAVVRPDRHVHATGTGTGPGAPTPGPVQRAT